MISQRHPSSICAMLFIVLVSSGLSGCQSSNNKWATAWRDRAKPKTNFEGIEGPEVVTYWPFKPGKEKSKLAARPKMGKDKSTGQSKSESQVAELTREGDQLRRNGQLEEARLVYSKALVKSPESADLHHRLAIIADKQHQPTVADEHYRAALKVRPQDTNLLSDLGYSYMLRGNSTQAEQTLKDALTIEPTHKGAMANLGSLYVKQNRQSDAWAVFRSGAASETEAQQFMAQLSPQGGSQVNPAGWADSEKDHWSNGPATASTAKDPQLDLSKMSFADVQVEMERRRRDAQIRRKQAEEQQLAQARSLSAGESLEQELAQRPQQQSQRMNPMVGIGPSGGSGQFANSNPMNQNQSSRTAPFGNGISSGAPFSPNAKGADDVPSSGQNLAQQAGPLRAAPGTIPNIELFQGLPVRNQSPQQDESQTQSAWGQPRMGGRNFIQPAGGENAASQLAAQMGMGAGPGSMFPIVPTTGIPATGNDGSSAGTGLTNIDHRFGSEFGQAPNYQNPQAAAGDGMTNGESNNDGMNSIGPASPTSNWGSSLTDGSNWQGSNAQNSSNWANAAQSPNNGREISPAGGQSASGQNSPRFNDQSDPSRSARGFRTDSKSADFNSESMLRNSNDAQRGFGNDVRPYNGAWPNTNSLPNSTNDRSQENMDTLSINPMNSGTGSNRGPSNRPLPNSSNYNSIPQWPHAPNR